MNVSQFTSTKKGVLSDIAEIIMGQSPNGESYNKDGNGVYCKIKVQTCAKNLYRVLHYFCA